MTATCAETWRTVPDAPAYRVSDLGRVYSTKSWRGQRGRFISPKPFANGYRYVSLDGLKRTIHSLVLLAFEGPCPDDMEIRHLDGDKLNCALSNLTYGTRSQNGLDTVRHGKSQWANRTHCPAGHEYTPENTYVIPGRGARDCRTCINARSREWKRRARARGLGDASIL
jgi:hypothetical protein